MLKFLLLLWMLTNTLLQPTVYPHPLNHMLLTWLVKLPLKLVTKQGCQTAASDALLAIASAITPTAVKAILPKLIDNLTNTNKWTEKVAILRAVSQLVDTAKAQIALRMPELIPVLSESMWDTKKKSKKPPLLP